VVKPVTRPVAAFTVAINGLAELHVPPGVEEVNVVDEPTQMLGPAKTVVGGLVIVINLFTVSAQGNKVLFGVKT